MFDIRSTCWFLETRIWEGQTACCSVRLPKCTQAARALLNIAQMHSIDFCHDKTVQCYRVSLCKVQHALTPVRLGLYVMTKRHKREYAILNRSIGKFCLLGNMRYNWFTVQLCSSELFLFYLPFASERFYIIPDNSE